MRSLQRIQHTRPREEEGPGERPATIHRLDRTAIRRRERRIWLRRAWTLARVALVLGIIGAGFVVLTGSRIVADGVVRANVTHVVAPARMRIAEWLIDVGASLSAGDPIVRLVPVERDTGRGVLAARVDAARARLAWFDAGGEQELLGAEQRMDRVVEAERNGALARAELLTLRSTLDVHGEAVALASSAVDEVRATNNGSAAAVDARRRSAAADVERAEVEFVLARNNAERVKQMGAEGLQSESAVETAIAGREAARATVASLAAVVLEIDVEGSNVRTTGAASEELATRALAVAIAQGHEAEAAIAAAEARVDAFAVEAAHHRQYTPKGPLDPSALRDARRAQLAADMAVAAAALASHDLVVGERVLVAHTSGVVDEILEVEGAVIEPSTVLLRHRENANARVVAYVVPATAADLEVGARCEVRCVAEGTSAEAVIVAVGGVWIEPAGLPPGRSDEPRVAVTLRLAPDAMPFRANARIKAVFDSDPWTAARRRVLDWFDR